MRASVTTPSPSSAGLGIRTKAKLFRGLADPSRLLILESVRSGSKCVNEVVEATGLSQPTVSMHLSCLWDCGLVERERQGRFVYYSVVDPNVLALLRTSDDLLVSVRDQVFVCSRHEVP